MPNKRIVVLMNEEVFSDLQTIMKETHIGNQSDAIRYAIGAQASKLVPAYIEKKRDAEPRQKYVDPIARAQKELERAKARSDAREQALILNATNICDQLNGTILEETPGIRQCKYTNFEKSGNRVLKGVRIVPFEKLGDEHVEAQYRGGTCEEINAMLQNGA